MHILNYIYCILQHSIIYLVCIYKMIIGLYKEQTEDVLFSKSMIIQFNMKVYAYYMYLGDELYL